MRVTSASAGVGYVLADGDDQRPERSVFVRAHGHHLDSLNGFLAALLALLHFYWKRSGKHHFDEVWVYGAVIALLLGWRLWRRFKPMILGR